MLYRSSLCALGLCFTLGSTLLAEIPFPESLHLRARAVDASGAALEGRHDLAVRLLDASGETELRVERRAGVPFTDGSFELKLGRAAGPLRQIFARHPELWLELTLDGVKQYPRISVLPAGHSQESRLLLTGRTPKEGELHWRASARPRPTPRYRPSPSARDPCRRPRGHIPT